MSLASVRAEEASRPLGRAHSEDVICRAGDSLFLAISRCLANGGNACLVVDDTARVIGRVTLEGLRHAIRAGELLRDTAIGQSIALLEPATSDTLAPLPLAVPDLTYAELEGLLDAFLSTWISGRGPHIEEFERAFAAFAGTEHAVAVSSGTAALHLALLALGIGPGDEVIVPDLTFAATINAVIHAGATPVIADIDRESLGLCPRALKVAVTEKTKAVIPVHLYGRPVLVETIAAARARGLAVIEDCAEAQGATLDGAPVGSLGDIGCFSLFANKLVTAGEGGMCVTSDADCAQRIREWRDHGVSCDDPLKHARVGYNYRLTNLQAAIGLAQIARYDEIHDRRAEVDALYRAALGAIPGVRFPARGRNTAKSVTWLSVVSVPKAKRTALIAAANREEIELRPFFYPLSAMPLYRDYVREPCVTSHAVSASGLCLPTSGREDEADAARVARVFRSVLAG